MKCEPWHLGLGKALALVVCLLPPVSAFAQIAVYETEPNDTPETANVITGEARLLGELAPGDQDGFLWTVSDVGAQKRWNFELEGVPGALTVLEIIRLQYSDDGVSVTDRKVLLRVASRDGGRMVTAEDLMFEPGTYLLGLARAGGNAPFRPPAASASFAMMERDSSDGAPAGGYRLALVKGSELGTAPATTKEGSTAKTTPIRPEYRQLSYATDEEQWFDLLISEAEAERNWNLIAQVPVGQPAQLTLYDTSGTELTQVSGGRRGQAWLTELSLAAGQYRALLKSDSETLRYFAVEEGGARVSGAEAEPNDTWQLANRIDPEQPLSGRFQRNKDTDFFRFALTPELSEQRLTLETVTNGDKKLEFCLLDYHGKELHCRSATGTVTLEGLSLDPADYGLSLSGGNEGTDYSIRLSRAGPREPGLEAEPNDSVMVATSMPANRRIKGSTDKDDTDFFRFVITEEPQLWRFQVMGEGVHEVAYHDGSGREVQKIRSQSGQRRITLDNLFLMPGVHYLGISGREDGQYTLLIRPLGAPDPNAELEPNDDPTRMLPLAMGQHRSGLLSDLSDRDNYRFHLANHDHIRLSIQPPVGGALMAKLYWGGTELREAKTATGKPLELAGVFPPGDYRLELITEQASDGEYRLELDRLERFACPVDCEPNDNPAFASALPPDGRLQGQVGEWGDEDWYALPIPDQDLRLVLSTEQKLSIDLVAQPGQRGGLERDPTGSHVGQVPAGEQRYLRIRGRSSYDAQVVLGEQDTRLEQAPAAEWALDMKLELETQTVAAYQQFGQRVAGTLRIRNLSPVSSNITLEAVTSDVRWELLSLPDSLMLDPAGTAATRVEVRVPDDAWADRAVRISVKATNDRGESASTHTDIGVGRDAAPVAPSPYWAVPDLLLGGLNVAWQSLGARWTGEEDSKLGRGLAQIFDGLAVRGEGLSLRSRQDPWQYAATVELAGEGSLQIAGIALNPLGRDRAINTLGRFKFALSDDGHSFHTVLDGKLQPQPREQYFILPQPRGARFARLELLDDYSGHQGGSRGLGEWKVIARPGTSPSQEAGFNLADPALGGHVSWASPLISQQWDDAVLQPSTATTRIRLRAGKRLEWVVGFHHNRAAQISGFDWPQTPDIDSGEGIASLDVAVSMDSPLGPWTPLTNWAFHTPDSTPLQLDAPVWARFLRFSSPLAEHDQKLAISGGLHILERPTDVAYQSILGEWGSSGDRAIYEASQPQTASGNTERAAHTSRATAAPITPGTPVASSVQLGKYEHWYRLQVPADQNTLLLQLTGDPTVRAALVAQTEPGEDLPLQSITQETGLHIMEAMVDPGSTVYLRVFEPPRNVVFAWDTSASVGSLLPIIYSGLATYAHDLVPGRDAANLMPFGAGLLMQDWYGEPYLVQTILNEYPRSESSSAAEKTLRLASEALERRPGTKAVVLITDAATGRDYQMWKTLERVRPRVFSVGLDSTGALGRYPAREQDLLQDWARVHGGHYAHVGSEGEMEVAFDRAASMLRSAAPYELLANTEFRAAPGPGTLRVLAPPEQLAGGREAGGILFILDASGSMLQRLSGQRRIEIARNVLIDSLTKNLQPGTPVAIRVFGHREPNACRTDLELPLQPLNPEQASALISSIEARNLARTPIADSVAKAEQDLAGVTGKKTIVLLSDGEETCGGDPEAVISALAAKGFDLQLNIIGFALDDESLERQFEAWAELGDGRYFSATDSDALSHALDQALSTPYTVRDSSGNLVATGVVNGEALDLPQGLYKVSVESTPQQIFENVRVTGGSDVALELSKQQRP